MKAKFKVGDKVRVLPRTGDSDDYRSSYEDSMCCLAGRIFTIEDVDVSEDSDSPIPDDGYIYKLREDIMNWNWNSSMLESAEDYTAVLSDSKQYFYLITKDGEPYRISLNPHKAIKDARTLATKNPDSVISIYRNLIATTAECELLITNVKSY